MVDLEADSGLAIIKSVQKANSKLRAIGVLTKSDGLRSVSKLNNIVNNDEHISKDLMLDDGYFVVNNLVDDNSDWYTKTFGLNSSIFKKKRYGVANLKSQLKKVIKNYRERNSENFLEKYRARVIGRREKDELSKHILAKQILKKLHLFLIH